MNDRDARGRRMQRAVLAGAVAAASLLSLSGCAVPGLVTTSACIDWVSFDTPADAATDADAVVLGSIAGQDGTTQYEGMTANIWTVEIEDWLKGSGSETIDVVSLPRSCGDTEDGMAEFSDQDEVVLFLRSTDSGWEGITPWQQAMLSEDGGYPEAWPDDLYD